MELILRVLKVDFGFESGCLAGEQTKPMSSKPPLHLILPPSLESYNVTDRSITRPNRKPAKLRHSEGRDDGSDSTSTLNRYNRWMLPGVRQHLLLPLVTSSTPTTAEPCYYQMVNKALNHPTRNHTLQVVRNRPIPHTIVDIGIDSIAVLCSMNV